MTLPEWLDPIYHPEEMRAADRCAIEQHGIPESELAERAGSGLAHTVRELAGPGPIRIVVGPGNNGADGMIAARLLRGAGYPVDVLAPLPLEGLEGVPRISLERLPGAPPRPFDAALLQGSGAVVDALLGTGFEGAVGEPLDGVIRAINAQSAPVIAADVPSGVNAATGAVEGVAVVANATATNHAPKIGLYVAPGRRHAGSVRVVDIGIPPGGPGASLVGLSNRRLVDMVPRARSQGEAELGAVVVAGGPQATAWTVSVTALAAQRGGARGVGVLVPASVAAAVDGSVGEGVVRTLAEGPNDRDVEVAVKLARRGETVVLGLGAGDREDEAARLRAIVRAHAGPLVVSAAVPASEALLEGVAGRSGSTVLVGGPEELSALLGEDPAPAGANRLALVRNVADRSAAAVLLAGPDPIVAAPGGPVAVNRSGVGALDPADVGGALAGLVGALLSGGMEPLPAAAAGASLLTRGGGAATSPDVVAALPRLR